MDARALRHPMMADVRRGVCGKTIGTSAVHQVVKPVEPEPALCRTRRWQAPHQENEERQRRR